MAKKPIPGMKMHKFVALGGTPQEYKKIQKEKLNGKKPSKKGK